MKQNNNIIEIYNVIEKLYKYREEISSSEDKISKMIEIYKFVKEILPVFYCDGNLSRYYGRVIGLIMSCESKLPKTFIMESQPRFDYLKSCSISKTLPLDNLLDNIVLKARKELLTYHPTNTPEDTMKHLCFTNDCYESSKIVKEICDDNDIKSYIIEIHPGFSKKANLCNGNGFHYFNIIKINTKYYLIDCTYRQFFKTKGNFLEKIGLLNMQGCLPGKFVLMSKERETVAKKILKDGWIELDEKVLKTYLDGFAISYRNGIYYEQTNDYSFEASYTTDDYIRFLKGEDNQINHEGKELLGYQKRPSK